MWLDGLATVEVLFFLRLCLLLPPRLLLMRLLLHWRLRLQRLRLLQRL